MRTTYLILVAVLFSGCRSIVSVTKDSDPLFDPNRISSFVSADREKAQVVSIEMVSYADAHDPSAKKSRLFITSGRAFRTVEELKSYLVRSTTGDRIHFVLQGYDASPGPMITWEEIDDLVSACRKANVWFTFEAGG